MISDVQNEMEPVFDFNSATLGLPAQNIDQNLTKDENFQNNAKMTGQS
jgi:hypothetical protein